MEAVLERTKPTALEAAGSLSTRERTRLWFRTERAEHDGQDVLISEQSASPAAASAPPEERAVRRERTGPLRSIEALQSVLDQADADTTTPAQAENIDA